MPMHKKYGKFLDIEQNSLEPVALKHFTNTRDTVIKEGWKINPGEDDKDLLNRKDSMNLITRSLVDIRYQVPIESCLYVSPSIYSRFPFLEWAAE